ncbi:MAG: hypothetical protein V4864_02835 [Pseudomonadota bacterium]
MEHHASKTSAIGPCPLPAGALLARHGVPGAYLDCYVTQLPRAVSQREFVEAFYTTAVFKIERWLLGRFVARPSTDAQAGQLACGESGSFAAWTVEARDASQLLLGDFSGRTKSWLMVEPAGDGTRLYFGSAVVPVVRRKTGKPEMGTAFHALLGFHKLYSRVLLGAARRRLARHGTADAARREGDA